MRGSIDRIEDNIAVIVWDDNNVENILNNEEFKEGDRVIKKRGIIKKIDNSCEKQEMIDLQNKIFKRR